ncbi:MAG TPA: CYTH domain-containing protein, partial [Methylibium sp.]|nr:CYTH domain-containing protein [Methylibium sp.]
MSEVELKLQVPAAALAAVERELARGSTQRLRLQAIYFDTADRRLAAAGLALRVRKEGRRWVQTLKSGSAHGIERSEHDVPLAQAPGPEPAADPALHAGTPPGETLAALLAPDGAPLLPL